MSVSSLPTPAPFNDLYRIAAVSSVVVGLFFCAGAYGHMTAAWSLVIAEADMPSLQRLHLLLPGGLLAITAFVNLCSSGLLWRGRYWAMQLAFLVNLLATLYLGYLLHRGVPDHPIGVFLALISTHTMLLGAIRVGLVWPAQVGGDRNG